MRPTIKNKRLANPFFLVTSAQAAQINTVGNGEDEFSTQTGCGHNPDSLPGIDTVPTESLFIRFTTQIPVISMSMCAPEFFSTYKLTRQWRFRCTLVFILFLLKDDGFYSQLKGIFKNIIGFFLESKTLCFLWINDWWLPHQYGFPEKAFLASSPCPPRI